MKFSRVVFCDFDGTITTEDTFVSILEKFTPEVSARLLPLIFERKMTLKEGIKQTIGSIPSIHYPEIIDYIADHPVRSGFKEFSDFLNNLDIPLVIVSGGLLEIVKAVLAEQQLLDQVTAIYAAQVDTTQQYLQVFSTIEGDTELVAKVKAMNVYPATQTIAIGDSVTDINMALTADVVFARDRLMNYLDEEGKSYIQWQDFEQIKEYLIDLWQV